MKYQWNTAIYILFKGQLIIKQVPNSHFIWTHNANAFQDPMIPGSLPKTIRNLLSSSTEQRGVNFQVVHCLRFYEFHELDAEFL